MTDHDLHGTSSLVLYPWNLETTQDAGQLSLPNYQQVVTTLYEQGQQLPQIAQDALFRWPLDQMLEQPLAVFHPWFERGCQYLNQQLKAAKTQAKLHTPDICSFFYPTPQQVNDLHLL